MTFRIVSIFIHPDVLKACTSLRFNQQFAYLGFQMCMPICMSNTFYFIVEPTLLLLPFTNQNTQILKNTSEVLSILNNLFYSLHCV